ncbi:hypothetical protein EV144_103418 [Flavobacterium sp. 270]|uniref:hypothetical protein n=1 Tax=Flavobacterium sp. 270 TaxID=2512114 RepID=UPI001067082D|nr:hypothetical protein [Flavobacterium sp. 270]TDW48898.1 hypothetical protein EV144_103418 [Flavobacterium sp. 270]
MKSTLDQIEDIKRDGYTIDFNTVFTHAFENYKKIALYSGLIILVFSIIFAFAFMGIMVAFYGAASLTEQFFQNLAVQKTSYLELVISTAVISAVTALLAPFGAGFLKMADAADKDESFDFSTIFTYYKGAYFAQIFVASLIITLISTSIGALIDGLGIRFLGTALSIMVNFFTYLSIPFIVFGNLKSLEAIKASLVIVTKNPGMIFILFVTGFIGSLLGLAGCCIGVLFTVVFNTSMTYATYFSIISMDQEEEDSIDSIGQSDFE